METRSHNLGLWWTYYFDLEVVQSSMELIYGIGKKAVQVRNDLG